jgi:hypothetical protein
MAKKKKKKKASKTITWLEARLPKVKGSGAATRRRWPPTLLDRLKSK